MGRRIRGFDPLFGTGAMLPELVAATGTQVVVDRDGPFVRFSTAGSGFTSWLGRYRMIRRIDQQHDQFEATDSRSVPRTERPTDGRW